MSTIYDHDKERDNQDVDGRTKKDAIEVFFEKYGKYTKKIALGIATVIMFSILWNADKLFSDYNILMASMLKCYIIIILVSYYLGGTPTALKSAAVALLVFFLLFVFIQKTPGDAANRIFLDKTPPPRDINWMTTKIETGGAGKSKIDLLRVYTGDTVYYYAEKGFWAEYEDGNRYFNNPSYNGQMMRFIITSAKKGGELIKVWSDEPFQLKYKVESKN